MRNDEARTKEVSWNQDVPREGYVFNDGNAVHCGKSAAHRVFADENERDVSAIALCVWCLSMPVYESECLQCGRRHDYIRPVAQCHETPECCGEQTAKRIFSAPAGFPDIPAYESPASGRVITSRAERREDFKRTGTREWEGLAAEKSEAERQRKYAEQELDKRVERTIGETLAALPPSKQDALMAA